MEAMLRIRTTNPHWMHIMHFAKEWNNSGIQMEYYGFARALHDDDDKTRKTWPPHSMRHEKKKEKKNKSKQHTLENHMGLWLCVCVLFLHTLLVLCRFYVNVILITGIFLSCSYSIKAAASERENWVILFSVLFYLFSSRCSRPAN